jgi:hypothetical protein
VVVHASQPPLHAVSQQTRVEQAASAQTQLPVAHSVLTLQDCPFSFR